MSFFRKILKKNKKQLEEDNPTIASIVKKEDGTIIEKIETEDGSVTRIISPGLEDGFPRKVKIIETQQIYDLSTINGINEIKEELDQTVDIEGYKHQIEYYLQRIATDYKKSKNENLVIACLKKSNNIMALKTDYYHEKDFLRLPKYLKSIGKFDEARLEEEHIKTLFPLKDISKTLAERIEESSDSIESNLVLITRESRICAECAKYHDRIYSINGADSRFPNYDIFKNYLTKKTCSCHLYSWPFSLGISIMRGLGENDPIGYSNRPFEDDRTIDEKKDYNEYINKNEADTKNRKDYDWIRENLPEIAPKSLSGYTKMRNTNSKNYQKIVLAAKENGYII